MGWRASGRSHPSGRCALRSASAAVSGSPPSIAAAISWLPEAQPRMGPDGRLLLTATGPEGPAGAIRIWDAGTGEPITAPLYEGGGVNDAEFSRDGRLVVSCGWDGSARVWELPGDDRPVQDLARW